MFKFKRDSKHCILFLTVLALSLAVAGCAQDQEPETNVKGIRDKIEAPTIKVKMTDGQVKEMPIEEYVAGVVAGEMQKDWPENAYAAQAIKARTFTMKRLQETEDKAISTEHEEAQAYKPENITPEIEQAVQKTKGEVAIYQDNYIKGWFHSSAGGETTTAKVGLNYQKAEPPYIKSVDSPDEEAPDDIKSWQVALTQQDIIKVLKSAGEEASQVSNLKIEEKDDTGRITKLKITHDQGTKVMHGADFREAVGPDKLKSTMVEEINKQGDKFVFSGHGYGHGVGMSQWGAYKLAKDGRKPEEIIDHYFKGVKIIKKWE